MKFLEDFMSKSSVFLRTPYNYDTMQASNESALECLDESLAQQNAKDESDINTIVRRFGLTGELPSNVRAPQYGDFSAATDYHSAMNAVLAANEAFMKLPAHIRTRFDNDPGAFVDFCSDEKNREEAKSLGLIVGPPSEPTSVGSTSEPTSNPAPEGGGVAQSST
jgi:phage internal scaffolding protein